MLGDQLETRGTAECNVQMNVKGNASEEYSEKNYESPVEDGA